MALLVWAVAAPGFVPAGALASGVGPTGPTVGVAATGEPTAAEATVTTRKLRSSFRFLALTVVTVSPRWPHE